MIKKIIECKLCKEKKEHYAKKLCKKCYMKKYRQKLIICENCGKEKVYAAKGLCGKCYREQNLIICKKCGELKPYYVKELCTKCYSKQNVRICKSCGELKPHNAKGLCCSCFKKQNLIFCKDCGELKPHAAFGLCITCYNHKIGKNQPMHLNKSCSSYLGVTIAEQVLSKVFKDVQKMPYGNIGYDFICSKGMKIDVKSAILKFDKKLLNYKGRWFFNIKKNTIPDYFLCIAFNNRSSLTPQHLWLIPSKKVSHKKSISISKNQTQKYSQYEQPLEKTLECCESMKKTTLI